jgi:predicted metal-dependent hydrolase
MMEQSQHQVQYGTTIIKFNLSFSQRKTLGITVNPDCRIDVVAPFDAKEHVILKKVEKKAKWIQKQIRSFNVNRKPFHPKYEYVSGESFIYLGRQYRLKVTKAERGIKLTGKFLVVSVPNKKDKTTIKELVDKWYTTHAKTKLTERFQRHKKIIGKESIRFNDVLIVKMAKRWGSCTEKGNIILNPALVSAPVDCIDYVIIHEICHLKFLNHSKKFYSLLLKYLPDWERRKRKLEKY